MCDCAAAGLGSIALSVGWLVYARPGNLRTCGVWWHISAGPVVSKRWNSSSPAGSVLDMPDFYLVVLVYVHVRPEDADAFRNASLGNAASSVHEPGVVRFDIIREAGDPTRFVLIEVYRDADGAAAHKQTPHYRTWRDAVAPMMAEPRTSKSFTTVSPASTWTLVANALL